VIDCRQAGITRPLIAGIFSTARIQGTEVSPSEKNSTCLAAIDSLSPPWCTFRMTIPPTTEELHRRLQDGSLATRVVTQSFLDRIQQYDGRIRAFLHVAADEALRQADAIDAKRKSGQGVGPLAGLPVAIKDVICESGRPCTCASRMLENFRPPYDAHVIDRLKAADAVLIGRTNLDEFAMGSSSENSAFQVTCNPWDEMRSPGGSSSGSAAAVAAGMAPVALGSDTGGSIRQPASFCGVVGFKPTYGRVSRYGLVAFASSLDQIGPLANDVYGAALLLNVISGHDRRDSTSVNRPVPDFLATLNEPLAGLRIGVADEHFTEGLDPDVERAVKGAIDVYRTLGATIHPIRLPHAKYAVATYYVIAPSEASSNLSRYDGIHYGHRAAGAKNLFDLYAASRGEGFGTEVKRRIMVGTFALSAGYADKYYVKALKVRRLIRRDFDEAFSQVDVIAGPVSPTPAFKIGELSSDPLAMYLSDVYTLSANLAGIPGMSIPCGFSSKNLPIGLQLLAPPFEEERLLRAARMYERATEWHHRKPL
jgi:aspartyl-tRNA(Asn)/glutamyl-tRNA(Gln) amidotransferase subunit A